MTILPVDEETIGDLIDVAEWAEKHIDRRNQAKATVKECEAELQAAGVVLRDTPHGTYWQIATPADRQGFEPFDYTERS